MKRKPFVGVIPPILTIFTEDGELDEARQRKFVEFLIKGGIHGTFVGGTYGSGVLMSLEERKRLLEIVIDQTKGRAAAIAHIGTTDTKSAIELARHAEEKGADAVAAIPPFYFSHNEAAIIAHYEALVKSVKLPVFAYNNPKASGFLITPRIAVDLAKVGLAGMKDSCANIVSWMETKDTVKRAGFDDFEMIIGTQALWAPAALFGAKAMISGLANVYPELVVDFYETTIKEGIEAAAEIQPSILRARGVTRIGPTVPTCHAILELRGVEAGFPRKPFQPISDAEKECVRKALVAEGLL